MNTEKENYQDSSSQNEGREANDREKNYNRSSSNNYRNNDSYDRGNSYSSTNRPYNNRRNSYNNDNNRGGYNNENRNYNRRSNYNTEGGYNQQGGEDRRGGYNNNRNYNSGNSYNRSYNNNYDRGNTSSESGNRYPNNNNRRYNNPNPNWRNSESSGSDYRNDDKPRRPRISRPTQTEGDRVERGGYNNNRGGYDNRNSGYDNRRSGGYNNNRGGYDNRRSGGYNNNNRGGYNNNRNGSDNRRSGGYNNNNRGGYNNNSNYSVKKQIEYKEALANPDEALRLNKFLANAGVCSRREADEFIQAGAVAVNDQIVTELGTKVKRSDEVRFNGDVVKIERKQYVLLNKPKDFVTTMDDPEERKTVMDLVKDACEERIYPVGRLDRKTTGVLLLTNDGELASKLTHPKYNKKKIYQVTTDRNVASADIDKILEGIELTDGVIKADEVGYIDSRIHNLLGIEIHSGKNRIVRRIFETLGYKVIKLDRVYFAGLTKKGLRRGDWRYLTQQEVNFLQMGSFE